MHLEGWIRQGAALGNMVTLEGGRMGRGSAAHENQLGAGRLDGSEASTQLRGALSAMGSTEVTEEAKKDRTLASQPVQFNWMAFRVESDQRVRKPRHWCILRRWRRQDKVDAILSCRGLERAAWLGSTVFAKIISMEPDFDLRQQVQKVYGQVAVDPEANHPFRVGRELAERAEYPSEWLSTVPAASVDSFAGVSCLPCVADVTQETALLDLGCGAGLDALLMSPKVRSVVGIDFSAEMLAKARDSAEAMGVGNVEFRLGDAERIPAEQSAFDAALVNGIFNLNPTRAVIFEELARVIKPGGVLWAAELILKGPLPPDVKPSRDDWFS